MKKVIEVLKRVSNWIMSDKFYLYALIISGMYFARIGNNVAAFVNLVIIIILLTKKQKHEKN